MSRGGGAEQSSSMDDVKFRYYYCYGDYICMHACRLIRKGFNAGPHFLVCCLWALGVSWELSQDDVVSRELAPQQRGTGFSLHNGASSGRMAQPYWGLNV